LGLPNAAWDILPFSVGWIWFFLGNLCAALVTLQDHNPWLSVIGVGRANLPESGSDFAAISSAFAVCVFPLYQTWAMGLVC